MTFVAPMVKPMSLSNRIVGCSQPTMLSAATVQATKAIDLLTTAFRMNADATLMTTHAVSRLAVTTIMPPDHPARLAPRLAIHCRMSQVSGNDTVFRMVQEFPRSA